MAKGSLEAGRARREVAETGSAPESTGDCEGGE